MHKKKVTRPIRSDCMITCSFFWCSAGLLDDVEDGASVFVTLGVSDALDMQECLPCSWEVCSYVMDCCICDDGCCFHSVSVLCVCPPRDKLLSEGVTHVKDDGRWNASSAHGLLNVVEDAEILWLLGPGGLVNWWQGFPHDCDVLLLAGLVLSAGTIRPEERHPCINGVLLSGMLCKEGTFVCVWPCISVSRRHLCCVLFF